MPYLDLPRRARRIPWGAIVFSLLALWLAGAAQAQDDPPGRVGRIAELQGGVSVYDHEQGSWAGAERNRPVTGGDRLSTGSGGRAEVRIGSTTLRLGGNSELEFLRLDDDRVAVQLHAGALALRLRSREAAEETEVLTAEARLLPQRAGHYRVDRLDDTSFAGAWRGELRVDAAGGPVVTTGQRAAIDRLRGGELRIGWTTLPSDGFANWVARDDERDERSASSRYVSPEMTGAEDLDRYGRWNTHPEFGAIWFPLEVSAGWEPYRRGHWAWVRPWGWTWVDDAPWGFAPFHYGRWVMWDGRWGWLPGAYVARPVYAPALVAFGGAGGGVGWSVSIGIGAPPAVWAPLPPREPYRPHFRASPIYVERVNPAPPYRWREGWRDGWREGGARWNDSMAREVLSQQPHQSQPPQAPQPAPQTRPQPRPHSPDEEGRQRIPRVRPPAEPQPQQPSQPVMAQPPRPVPTMPAPQAQPRPQQAPQPSARERMAERVHERMQERPRERGPERGAEGGEQRQQRPEQRGNGNGNRERGENQR